MFQFSLLNPRLLYLVFGFLAFNNHRVAAQDFYLLIGTYTQAKPDKGIYVYKFNSKTGSLTFVNNAEGVTNPSYLTLSPNGNYVYACVETQVLESGNISAFQFDKKTGGLTHLNKIASGGDDPCYIAIDKSGKWVVNANYTGGSASIAGVEKNGAARKTYTSISIYWQQHG
jgi:6-phosphogluconolactonase